MLEQRPEKVRVNGEWYILCSSVPLITRKLTLKGNRAFLLVDALGDVPFAYPTELGYYWMDTRFLSGFEMYVNGARPLLLSSGIDSSSSVIRVEMTNTDFKVGDKVVQRTSVYIGKKIFFEGDRLRLRLRVRNLALFDLPFDLLFKVDADFLDMFEVRGVERERRGERLEPKIEGNRLILSYRGLDGILRRTVVEFPESCALFAGGARYETVLKPDQLLELWVSVDAEVKESVRTYRASVNEKPSFKSRLSIGCSDHLLESVLNRSLRDLDMMLTDLEGCSVPMAGIPWYCTLFGRDSLITAYELLPWCPEVARDTLNILARYQAKDFDDFTDSEPGKILHEIRSGEMANLRELPFVPYYGTADATPLFIILAAEYLRCTGDLEFLRSIWENLVDAARWMQLYGDLNGDDFIEYKCRSPLGLRNQGWKDSHDSIHHRDGTLAEPPLAVVEIQGYKYRALMDMAYLSGVMGLDREGETFKREALRLYRKINEAFWMKDKKFYALAIDRGGRLCEVVSSNPGHLLFAGAVPVERARWVVQRLMDSKMFSGFGIRTLSQDEVRYNPMSYHNGSVWPHDCAIICSGMVEYRFKPEALRVFEGILDAVSYFDDHRVPELFCGFPKERNKAPVPYPVACIPQAWSSASIFLMLKSLLGLRVDARNKTVCFDNPVLPERVGELVIENWETPYFGPFSFRFTNVSGRCAVETMNKPVDWRVVVVVG